MRANILFTVTLCIASSIALPTSNVKPIRNFGNCFVILANSIAEEFEINKKIVEECATENCLEQIKVIERETRGLISTYLYGISLHTDCLPGCNGNKECEESCVATYDNLLQGCVINLNVMINTNLGKMLDTCPKVSECARSAYDIFVNKKIIAARREFVSCLSV